MRFCLILMCTFVDFASSDPGGYQSYDEVDEPEVNFSPFFLELVHFFRRICRLARFVVSLLIMRPTFLTVTDAVKASRHALGGT